MPGGPRKVGGTEVVSDAVVAGDDGIARCWWAVSPAENRSYHDEEWGRPVGDDNLIYENLCLEGFQSGLSWLTVLRKREGFRKAFAGFDPGVVATFGPRDVKRLLSDASIIRHRGKIEAAIANARAIVNLRAGGTSLAGLVWGYEVRAPRAPVSAADLAASTEQSKALSARLRQLGFRFVGPTTVYASMQSLGVVNDHLRGCHFRSIAEAERSAFKRPA
jgi:DNA-3-methyladenine glycosylase I